MLNWIEVNADSLRHNYRQFLKIAGECQIAPVLKSNAYGHGLELVYSALISESPKWLCVNYVSEAEQLRKLGFEGRILVVGPAASETLELATQLKLDIVVGHREILDEILEKSYKVSIHIKFDTGMGRQGFHPEDCASLLSALKPIKEQVRGVATHFANVEDVTEQSFADNQLMSFRSLAKEFSKSGIDCLQHIASSASCLLMEGSRSELSRIGISLYGFWPSQATKISYLQTYDEMLELKPALSWLTQISALKEIEAGKYVGYGCSFKTNMPTKVAVLPVGYFEGYPRIAGEHNSYVLVDGKRCPIIGRICMNMMMVDVTHLPKVGVGDRVTLLGTDQGESILASDLAGWAQTIHYELVTRLNGDIPRKMVAG